MPFDLSQAFNALGSYQPSMPDSSGIMMALAQNALQPAQAPVSAPVHHGGIGNVLGIIGDALSTANGGPAVHAQAIAKREAEAQQAQIASAIQNYLGDTDAGLAAIFAKSPEAGIALYKMKHGDAPTPPEIIRDYEYRNGLDPQAQAQFDKVVALMHPGMMSPITLPADSTLSVPSEHLPSVSSPEDAAKLPPGTRFRMPDGRIGTVPGGATASTPSPTFR